MKSSDSGAVWVCGLVLANLLIGGAVQAQELRPNIRALPPGGPALVLDSSGNPELRFVTTSWNSGAGPLEVIAGEGSGGVQPGYQRVWNADGSYVDHLVGTFEFHPDHQHFHLGEYALYTLTPISAPGQALPQSIKTSFCLLDVTKVNLRLPGAPRKAVYTTCGLGAQGISIGWGDTYGAALAGQSIGLAGYSDGIYELSIAIDPANKLLESNDDDNMACIRLNLSISTMTVQELGTCGATGSPVTVTSIQPSTAAVGATVDVVIRGTNFTTGIAVGFEAGSGPTPVASNVTVLDSSTISATVTVKNGGRSGDPLWNLRVGSGVLIDAFLVTR